MLRATVSGSFHRHMAAIYEAVGDLRVRGVDILSPSDPRVVDFIGDFLFVASDKLRSIKLVQDRHLECIRASDFLWVVCPDGYTGVSTSMEIGAAVAAKVPVLASVAPNDVTLREYVRVVPGVDAAVSYATARRQTARKKIDHVLVDPDGVISRSIDVLGDLRPALLALKGDAKQDAERSLSEARATIGMSFGLM